MTPEQLEILVLEAKNAAELCPAFAPLTDAERRALAGTASELKSQIYKNAANKDASKRLQRYFEKTGKSTWDSPAYHNVTLALFALCPVSAVKKTDVFVNWSYRDGLGQILLDRRPEWLDGWIAHDLQTEFPTVTFSMLRRWIREGICRKPAADGYYRMLAWNLAIVEQHRDKAPRPPLSQQLLAEPDMLEDVWRLFEIDNQAFNSDGWRTAPGAPSDYESWPEALIKLSEAGHLDRARLLDASLDGLWLDIKQNQLSGLHKFHRKLAPTKKELADRQAGYLALLCHRVGHVVKFALTLLSSLERDGELQGNTFLAEVQAVFLQEAKGNAISALKLIKRVISREASLLNTGLEATIEALRHANIDVQNAAVELLDAHRAQLTDAHKTALQSTADYIAVSLKNKVLRLADQAKTPTASADRDGGTGMHTENAALLPSELLPSEQQALGLTAMLSEPACHYASIPADIMQQSMLPSLQPLTPIATADELISAVSHAVEVVESPDEVERILDGISRLCNHRGDDFSAKVAPLRHRLEQGEGLAAREGIADGSGGARLALADLILTWLGSSLYQSSNADYFHPCDSLAPSIARIRAITARVHDKKPQALLAAPTHSGGWIDPLVWIQRLTAAEKHRAAFDREDFCLSLLRLAPDNRAAALTRAGGLSQHVHRVAAFALGGGSGPTHADRRDYDIWICAARSRAPYADWSGCFEPLKLDDRWADSVLPAAYHWRAYQTEHKREYGPADNKTVHQWKTPRLDIKVMAGGREMDESGKSTSVLAKLARTLSPGLATDWRRLPSAALNQRSAGKYTWAGELHTAWVAHWLVYQWPLCPDGAYISGVKQALARIDMDGSNWEPGFGFFYGLFQKHRPWRQAGHLLLCIGLAGKDADSRGLAMDALTEGIENGCVEIELLSETLVRLAQGQWLKLNRLGDNLLQLSGISLLHAWVVNETLQRWIARVDLKQHNIYKVLEVLLETQSSVRQPLTAQAAAALKTVKGGSKAARLATRLLKSDDFDAAVLADVRQLAIEYRLRSR